MSTTNGARGASAAGKVDLKREEGNAAKALMSRSGQVSTRSSSGPGGGSGGGGGGSGGGGGKAAFSELMKRDSFREIVSELHNEPPSGGSTPGGTGPGGAPALQVNGEGAELIQAVGQRASLGVPSPSPPSAHLSPAHSPLPQQSPGPQPPMAGHFTYAPQHLQQHMQQRQQQQQHHHHHQRYTGGSVSPGGTPYQLPTHAQAQQQQQQHAAAAVAAAAGGQFVGGGGGGGSPRSPGGSARSGASPDPNSSRNAMRLEKNRLAAKECRRKKKEYVKCLEERVAVLEQQNYTLIEELRKLKALVGPIAPGAYSIQTAQGGELGQPGGHDGE